MSEEIKDIPVLEVVSNSFARKNAGLTSLELSLKKRSKAAVEKLEKIMNETKDEALAIKCAEIIVKMHMQVSKEISDDQFKRMLADVRFNGNKMLVNKQSDDDSDEENENNIPILDFDNIRSVDMD